MERLELTSVHVAPALSELNNPPSRFSTSAYTRFGSAGDTATPILPFMPLGRPVLRVISVHVSPPSVDLKRPEPGPPEDIVHSVRYASQRDAYMMSGFVWSILMSTPPVLSSR